MDSEVGGAELRYYRNMEFTFPSTMLEWMTTCAREIVLNLTLFNFQSVLSLFNTWHVSVVDRLGVQMAPLDFIILPQVSSAAITRLY